MRIVRTLLVCVTMLGLLIACGQPTAETQPPTALPENTAVPTAHSPKIVASTSWVAAFAKAAGATEITVIAPSSLQHPPDYDPKPSDLAAIAGADYVLMAGFEGFAAKMTEAVGQDTAKLVTVATENSPEAIHKEVTRLGALFGTADAAAAYLAAFDTEYAALAADVQAAVNGAQPVVVNQLFVTPFVYFAGLQSAGSYGPMPMTPAELKTLSDLNPAYVFENAHMPAGQAIVEATGAVRVDLVNFPGDDYELLSVFRSNAATLKTVFAGTTATPNTTAGATTYPVTITDCGGRSTTYTKAPERIVVLDPSIAETLLLLGLKDKIVGFTEFQTPDQRWKRTAADMATLPVINKDMGYPSKEAILATTPDFVTSIYPSALLSNAELPTRDGWAALGVQSYLTQAECHEKTDTVTDLQYLYQDIANLGVIFDAQAKATALIDELKARVAAITPVSSAAAKTVWSYSGEKDPYPAGGSGTPNAIITLAGAKNAFADIPKDYDAVSWEEIVKRNPDVLWIMTAAGEGMFIDEADGIMEKLAADPRLKDISAVKNRAYVIVSYNDGGIESPRNVDAIEAFAAGLAALK